MKLKIISAFVLVIVLAVVADQRAVFGYREATVRDYVRVIFEFFDAETRAPISDVHVICTKPMIRSACSESPGPKFGQTTVNIAVLRKVKETILFEQALGYSLGRDGILFLRFVALGYEHYKMHLSDDDALLSATHAQRIELQREVE